MTLHPQNDKCFWQIFCCSWQNVYTRKYILSTQQLLLYQSIGFSLIQTIHSKLSFVYFEDDGYGYYGYFGHNGYAIMYNYGINTMVYLRMEIDKFLHWDLFILTLGIYGFSVALFCNHKL